MDLNAIREIERRAEAGEAEAQYALAAICQERREPDAARQWLERAAAQGHADALFTIAGAKLTAAEGARAACAEAVAGLEEARAKGSLAALRALAALTAAGVVNGGWPAAFALLREACERGDAAALRETAALLLDGAPDDVDGAAMLAEAARRDPLAAALVERRKRRGCAPRSGGASVDRAFSALAAPVAKTAPETISERPKVAAHRAALGPDLCDHLMGRALPRLRRQEVMLADGSTKPHPHRTAWGAGLGFGFLDLPAVFAGQTMALAAGAPYANGEALAILRYRPGEQYRPHQDYLDKDDPDLQARGQRVRTALLYLNDGYAGGETQFVFPDLRFAGKTGDVLVFDNVDEHGEPDRLARHAGLPVTSGEKWLATIWFRDRPFSG
jgi:prolyl 4-hydroxylase